MAFQVLQWSWESTISFYTEHQTILLITALNQFLRCLRGDKSGTRSNNADQMFKWFSSIEALQNTQMMWQVMRVVFHGTNGMNQFIIQLKQKFGVDFQYFNKFVYFLSNFKYSLRKIRKKVVKR